MSTERLSPTPEEPEHESERDTPPPTNLSQALCPKNVKAVWNYAHNFGLRGADAEDVAQTALWNAARRFATFDHARGPIRPWLFLHVKSAAYRLRRTGKRSAEHVVCDSEAIEHAVDLLPTPEGAMSRKEQSEFLRSAMDAMREELRDVVAAHLSGLTLEETAVALSIPVGTAASRMVAAKKEIHAAAERRRAAQKFRGILPLPFTADQLLHRERMQDIDMPDDVRDRLHAKVDQLIKEHERGPASGMHDRPAARHPKAGRGVRELVRQGLRVASAPASAIAGGVIVYLVMRGHAPAPSVPVRPELVLEVQQDVSPAVTPSNIEPTRADVPPRAEATAQAALPEGVAPDRPRTTSHARAVPAAKRSTHAFARSAIAREMIQAATTAMEHGELATARAILERNAAAFEGELEEPRALLLERIGRMERAR